MKINSFVPMAVVICSLSLALGQQGQPLSLLNTAKFSQDADNIRYDARGHRVVVGYGDGALAFLDPSGKKTGEIPLDAHPESFQPFDEGHHRLLIGCRAPARLLVIDTESGRQTASVEMVGDTDDLFYDAALGRVYVPAAKALSMFSSRRASIDTNGLHATQRPLAHGQDSSCPTGRNSLLPFRTAANSMLRSWFSM